LIDSKFSRVYWKGNEGFYYSSYDKTEGSELSEKTDQHKLYYHKLNTPQSDDEVIFGGTEEEKHRYVSGYVTRDNNYLVISASISTSGNKLFIQDLKNPNSELVTIMATDESDTNIMDNEGTKLYLVTNLNAPNRRVVTTDVSNPTPEHWVDFIPETEHVLNPSIAGEYFFANYMEDATSTVKQYDGEANLIREIELPGVGTASGFGAKKEETELYYSFANYITPGSIYKLDLDSGISELYYQPSIDFDSEDYESKQVFYTSKDGTKVPMIITHKKGIE